MIPCSRADRRCGKSRIVEPSFLHKLVLELWRFLKNSIAPINSSSADLSKSWIGPVQSAHNDESSRKLRHVRFIKYSASHPRNVRTLIFFPVRMSKERMHKIAELFCALTSSPDTEAELIVDCAIFSNLRQSLIALAKKICEYSISSCVWKAT